MTNASLPLLSPPPYPSVFEISDEGCVDFFVPPSLVVR